jgi:hypothetical protein
MKLDHGNPNLMRVNKEVSLGNFANVLGDKAHAKERRGFKPSVKDPEAVPAPAMNIWARESYKPEPQGYVRPGANDHLKFKSRGF